MKMTDCHKVAVMPLMSYGADLNARNSGSQLPFDCVANEEMNRGHKRATEHDRHPNTTTSSSARQEEDDEQASVERMATRKERKWSSYVSIVDDMYNVKTSND